MEFKVFIGLIFLPVFTESTAVQQHAIVAPINEALDEAMLEKQKERAAALHGAEGHDGEEVHDGEEGHDDATVH